MCTLTTKNKMSRAILPVKCYKIVHALGTFHHTPLQGTTIPYECFSGKRKTRKTFEAKGVAELSNVRAWIKRCFGEEYKYQANEGFIHCFKNKADAIMAAKKFMYSTGFENTEVWEVKLPFATKYIEGVNSWSGEANHPLDKLPTVAAEKIMFIQQVC